MTALHIGWILVGDERVASARLQGWYVHTALAARGHHSQVLNSPSGFDTRLHWKWPRRWWEALRRRDVVVFQKVESSRAVAFAKLLRRIGTRVVFAQSDPLDSPMYAVSDAVVASSTPLRDWLVNQGVPRAHAIDEPIDLLPRPRAAVSSRTSDLRAVFIGSAANVAALDLVKRVLAREEFRDIALQVVSDHPLATVAWSPVTTRQALLDADIALLPCLDTPAAQLKSANRLTLFLSAGLATICSALPSYAPLIAAGGAIAASSEEQWASALRTLRSPAQRAAIGDRGAALVWEQFAPERIGESWEQLLIQVRGQ